MVSKLDKWSSTWAGWNDRVSNSPSGRVVRLAKSPEWSSRSSEKRCRGDLSPLSVFWSYDRLLFSKIQRQYRVYNQTRIVRGKLSIHLNTMTRKSIELWIHKRGGENGKIWVNCLNCSIGIHNFIWCNYVKLKSHAYRNLFPSIHFFSIHFSNNSSNVRHGFKQ